MSSALRSELMALSTSLLKEVFQIHHQIRVEFWSIREQKKMHPTYSARQCSWQGSAPGRPQSVLIPFLIFHQISRLPWKGKQGEQRSKQRGAGKDTWRSHRRPWICQCMQFERQGSARHPKLPVSVKILFASNIYLRQRRNICPLWAIAIGNPIARVELLGGGGHICKASTCIAHHRSLKCHPIFALEGPGQNK